MSKRNPKTSSRFKDRWAFLALIVLSIALRIPFLKNFDLVSYDGTYYINQARTLFSGQSATSFPEGFPAFIALFTPLLRDGVRAAQAVSLLAGLASICVFFILAKRFVPRGVAFAGTIIFALSPLFIQLSLMTMSESLYVLFVLLGLLWITDEHFGRGGLALGMAAVTRPEAIGIVAAITVFKATRPKRVLVMLGGFALVYALGVTTLSMSVGHVQVLSKTNNFGLSAGSWKVRERWIASDETRKARESLEEREPSPPIVVDYLKRLPKEVRLLHRHVLPVVLLLALYGIFRKRGIPATALLPFLVYPIFTPRSEPRFLYPYVPILILYAVIAVETLRPRWVRASLVALLLLSGIIGFWVNQAQLTTPISGRFVPLRKLALSMRSAGRIQSRDIVADRKPFFAFYAGAHYLEIPVGPYERTIKYLVREKVRYLMLDKETIIPLRPALLPLIFDRATIIGELRFRQLHVVPDVAILYERNTQANGHVVPMNGLAMRRMTVKGKEEYSVPCWSPDGTMLAFRALGEDQRSRIALLPAEGGNPQTIIIQSEVEEPLSWSPDAKNLAFTLAKQGTSDIGLYDLERSKLRTVTSEEVNDHSPSWSPDGHDIAFSSTRSGASEIWIKDLDTGSLEQITFNGGNQFPSFSPTGDRLAWIRADDGIYLLDRTSGRARRLSFSRKVFYRPAWNRDGRCLAITAEAWLFNKAIYLVDSRSDASLLLTKSDDNIGMPSFHPKKDALAAVIYRPKDSGVWEFGGLQPYLERLYQPGVVQIFPKP